MHSVRDASGTKKNRVKRLAGFSFSLEAHQMLSDTYNWFAEGFDTKDLQEAKALLDSLESRV